MIAWLGIRGIGSIYYLMHAIDHGLANPLAEQITAITLYCISTGEERCRRPTTLSVQVPSGAPDRPAMADSLWSSGAAAFHPASFSSPTPSDVSRTDNLVWSIRDLLHTQIRFQTLPQEEQASGMRTRPRRERAMPQATPMPRPALHPIIERRRSTPWRVSPLARARIHHREPPLGFFSSAMLILNCLQATSRDVNNSFTVVSRRQVLSSQAPQ